MALFWVKIKKCCNPGVTVNRADAAARKREIAKLLQSIAGSVTP